ncbi:MAG: glycosyltransferase family 4 protein [Betaproteobacteria bacterium]|nr:glycosyltransferase family 4 protein [Betaproteobacteria bacterium]
MNDAAILHVTSLFGGGVDRHLRDIVRTVERPQLVWHAGEGVDVLEDTRKGRFYPLAGDALPARASALAQWLRARRVGLVHLHQLTRAPRERGEWACRTLGVPCITTLHDILFLRPDAFAAPDPLVADTHWLAETARTLLASKAVLAPSPWLARLAAASVPGLRVDVVPNGSVADTKRGRSAPREGFARHRPDRVVALLGALGPHKGSDLVDDIAACLEGSGIGLVVIGYLEKQLHPGWRIPGSLFVHGAFAEGDAAPLLRGYDACLVLMPNELPESFSYALSDAWAAGVPVLAAPRGALAERIAAHGGGWLLPERFDAAFVAARVRELAGGVQESERARVQSALALPDPERIPSIDAMTRSLDAFYTRFGIDPAAPDAADAAAIESLVAKNLDGSLFRLELVRLSDELAQTLAALEDANGRAQAFETEARGWIAKLEADVGAVQDGLRRVTEDRDRLAKEADLLRLNQEALDRLPSPVKRLLLKLAFDARR